MTLRDADVMARAKRAYEMGRFRSALPVTMLVVPLYVMALAGCARLVQASVMGVVLLATAIALKWKGGTVGRAVEPGLFAGAVPASLPLLLVVLGHGCAAGVCATICLPACVVAGMAAGAVVSWRALALDARRASFLFTAGAVAALTGSMGCLAFGFGGLAGVLAGVLVGAVPALVVAPHRGR